MSNWPLDHYKRWDIEYDTATGIKKFKSSMSSYFENIVLDSLEATMYNVFTGEKIASETKRSLGKIFSTSLDMKVFIYRIQAALAMYEDAGQRAKWLNLCHGIEVCLGFAPNIGIKFYKGDSTAYLYPEGAEILDENVVNQTLKWLESHPKALGHFEIALKLYMENDEAKQRSLLNELRNAIEQLLKEILSNSKPIEQQTADLKVWLTTKGGNEHVRSLYSQLLFGPFTKYQNDIKHTREFDAHDIEFMIYLTGIFMRQLLQLERNA